MFPSGRKIRVLQVHDGYAPGWGGEETVVALERELLRERGHAVDCFRTSHGPLKEASTFRQMLATPGFFWSQTCYRAIGASIAEFDPDVLHVHNTFPLLSPSVFWAAHHARVPVVQTLHNFRYACANSILLRDGKPCERCVGRTPWPALRYRCYSGSLMATAVVVALNLLHSRLTYHSRVDAFILLNDFSRQIVRRAQLPEDRLFLKANFVPASLLGCGPRSPQAVFVGSISRSKGVPLLLESWAMAAPAAKLLLIGDGRERAGLERRYRNLANIEWCGQLDRAEVLKRVAASHVLVFPSLAYENCPMAVLEALSVGTPVIASAHPSLEAIIRHEGEGLLFAPGSAVSLAASLRTAIDCPKETWQAWSRAARQAHAGRFSASVNYEQLISIYESVIKARFLRGANA